MGWSLLYRRFDILPRIWRWGPALLWLVLLACLAVEVAVRSDLVWRWGAEACGVPERLVVRQRGVERLADRERLHAEVYGVYFHDRQTLDDPVWSLDELGHVRDVKALLDLIRWVGLGCAAVVAVCSLLSRERVEWLRRSGALVGGLLLGGGLLCLEWAALTRLLHPLVFPHGNWDFLPGQDVIIALYPQALLAAYAGCIIGLFALLGLLAWLAGRLLSGEAVRWAWSWRPSQAWLLLPLLLGLFPAWWLGGRMFSAGDPGYWSWYALSTLLVIACMALLALPDKVRPLLLLLLTSALWWAQMAGLVHQVRLAASSVADDGEAIRGAIERYCQAHAGWPPTTLDELVPGFLPELVAPRGAAGAWYYQRWARRLQLDDSQRRSRRDEWLWVLGFHGPLDYMHEYSSERGDWNVLPWAGLL
jgi:hypothetical protein